MFGEKWHCCFFKGPRARSLAEGAGQDSSLPHSMGVEVGEGAQYEGCLLPHNRTDTRRHQQGKGAVLSTLKASQLGKEMGPAEGEAGEGPIAG